MTAKHLPRPGVQVLANTFELLEWRQPPHKPGSQKTEGATTTTIIAQGGLTVPRRSARAAKSKQTLGNRPCLGKADLRRLIPRPSLHKKIHGLAFARRGGVKRMMGGSVDDSRSALKDWLRCVLHDSVALLECRRHARRTVKETDVLEVLRRRGCPLYR